MFLVDTNVLSEALRPSPDMRVVSWLDRNFATCAISSITVFELSAGVALLAPGKRKEVLALAITRLVRRFEARIYGFDQVAAEAAARLLAQARARGSALHQVPAKLADLQIAGIAAAYELTLVTRNIGDFDGLGIELVNPWA